MTTDEDPAKTEQPAPSATPTENGSGENVAAAPSTDAGETATPSVAETLAQMDISAPVTDSVESTAEQSSVAPVNISAPQPTTEASAPQPQQTTAPAVETTTQQPQQESTPVAEASPTEPSQETTPPANVNAPETPDQTVTAAVEAPPDTEPTKEQPADTAQAQDERPSDRIRQKLGGTKEEKPVGSVDLKSQRPEIPTNTEPVDIPDTDELAADIEAQISAAMTQDIAVPSTTVPIPEEERTEIPDVAAADPAAVAPPEVEEVGPGSRVKGTVQHIHGDDVFLNAGLLSDVVISLKQFAEGKSPAVGDELEVVIENADSDGLFRARLPEAKTKAGGNWDGLAVGQTVDCTVTGTNKGGLQVLVSNLKGFLPASQVDLGYVSDLEKYVGQTLSVQITEVKPKKRNLVVSRRALLQAEREQAQAGFWETIEVGQDLSGTVKTLKNYGAFVNLGPIDGFLHVGEISWSRINHPNEVLKEGQEIQVRILKIDKEKNRISLGMKQLVQNPWQGLSDRYPSERILTGKVTRIADFGAFVELEPGVEGLVHISQLAWRRVSTVGEVLKVGDEKEFKVLEVDQKRKRVSLSLKALEQKPESVKKAEAEEEARPQRKPNTNLRGGMGNQGGGGLFGNPSDFNS